MNYLSTNMAHEGLLSGVRDQMSLEASRLGGAVGTVWTLEGSHASVEALVHLQGAGFSKSDKHYH